MSYAIIRGKITKVSAFATAEQAARYLNGREVWIVTRTREGGRLVERIVPAVLNSSRGDLQALAYRKPDGAEAFAPRWHSYHSTFAAAKKTLVDQAKSDVRDSAKSLREAKRDLRLARSHRRPKRVKA